MDDGTSIAPDGDLWAFIGDELKMGIPEKRPDSRTETEIFTQ
ncbi:Membrane-bound lytic murein transglycosylase D precursor [Escherichia coli ISC41]|nr:Membrane-bound lytic murein transglycosylase D precursor [Escherichia coli ISC41]